MKKVIYLIVGLLLIMVAPIFAQDVPDIPGWEYLYSNFGTLMGTFLGVAAIASFLGEPLVRVLKIVKKLWKVVLVMVLAVGISFIGNAINVGYLAEANWWQTLLWGLLSGAAANGVRSGNLLFFKSIVDWLIGFLVPKEPKE